LYGPEFKRNFQKCHALLSQEGSATQRCRARGGSDSKPCRCSVLEPPLARFRLRLNRAVPLTQGDVAVRYFRNATPRFESLASYLKINGLRGDAVFVVSEVIFNDELQRVIPRGNLFELHLAREDKLLGLLRCVSDYRLAAT